MLLSDWLSYYQAICYSPLVTKSAGFENQNNGSWIAFLLAKVVLSQYFWPTSWILQKQYYSSHLHGLWVNSPWGRRPNGLLTLTPFRPIQLGFEWLDNELANCCGWLLLLLFFFFFLYNVHNVAKVIFMHGHLKSSDSGVKPLLPREDSQNLWCH